MKQKADTLPHRRPALWLFGLCLLAAPACSGGTGGTLAAPDDPKLRAITESGKTSKEIREALITELRQRDKKGQTGKTSKPGTAR
jgi:hypothetical protein